MKSDLNKSAVKFDSVNDDVPSDKHEFPAIDLTGLDSNDDMRLNTSSTKP